MIKNVVDLQSSIEELEAKKLMLEEDLGRDFKEIKSGLTPSGFLKNTFFSSTNSSPIPQNLLKISLGLVAAFLIKRFSNKIPKESLEKGIGALVAYAIGKFFHEGNMGSDKSFFANLPATFSEIISQLFSKNKAEA